MRVIFVLLSILFCLNANATNLMYPELNVAPKASERLKIEKTYENKMDWTNHLPVQVSALATIVAALQVSSADLKPDLSSEDKDEEEKKQSMAALMGIGVGAFWIGASVWASMKYRPYSSAIKKVSVVKGNSLREQLTRERLAEEEINNLKTLGKRVRWASVVTNLLASGTMASVKVDTEKSSAQTFANISALLSFAPLFFKYRWEKVADEQDKYKKKIYSPVSYAPIMVDPFIKGQRATGLNLNFTF